MGHAYIIGIDEAGRGPLAGPVAVGVVCVSTDFNWEAIPGVADSKLLSPKKREAIYARAKELQTQKKLYGCVELASAQMIDQIGIVGAINEAMRICLERVEAELGFGPEECEVRLDGALKAPQRFVSQRTIIKGDVKEKVIGLASILAKVTRDLHMVQLAQQAPYMPYDLSTHKGYGTRKHCEMIRLYGLSDIHRASFCSRLIV